MSRSDETPTSERLPSARVQQPFPAAPAADEWASFVDELASAEMRDEAQLATLESALVELTEAPKTPREPLSTLSAPLLASTRLPSSARTKTGPYGVSTERKLRTLDPREPSVERTRLDLFTVPKTAPERTQLPPSYRTRVGLYFVPQEPATEPSLPDCDEVEPPKPSLLARFVGFWRRL